MLIKDICSSLTDGSHNPPQGISESSFLMLSSKNVFDDNITFDEPRFLSKEDFEKENKRTNIKTGDILLTIVGTVGRSAVVTADLPPFTLQRSVAVLHPNIEVCNERYLMYALQGRRSYIENRAKGVAQKGIYLKEVAGIDIPVPAKDVQNKIVAKLDKVNLIIKYRRTELLKLDELVKARFVEMFGDVASNPKHDGVPLGSICTTLSGGTPTTKVPEYYDGDIPWISTPYLGNNHINGSSAKAYITEDAIKNSATHLIPANTIMFGIRVGVGKSSIIDEPMCANQDIVALMGIDTAKYNLLFVKHVLDGYQNHFDSIKKGATILGITTEDLKKVLIPVVNMELQNEFANFVKQIDKSKFVQQKHLKYITKTYNHNLIGVIL